MIQHHGTQSSASQALRSHADQMIASGRQAIMSLDRAGGQGRGAGAGAGANASPDAAGGAATRSLAEARAGNDDRREAAGVATRADTPARGDLTAAGARIDQLARLGRQVIDAVQALDTGNDQGGAGARDATGTAPGTGRDRDAGTRDARGAGLDTGRDRNTNAEGRSGSADRPADNPARGGQTKPGGPQTSTGPTNNAARPGR
jgi:hypothetical protein